MTLPRHKTQLPRWLTRLAVFNVAFTVAVILWGAIVRKTHSGAGCGDHWPLCNGDIVPLSPTAETLIEFVHRTTSGLALVGVFVMWLASRRLTAPDHRLRSYAWGGLVFMVLEALIGAGIVVFGLVERNDSALRAAVIGLHLANTFVLLAFLALTALVATTGRQPKFKSLLRQPLEGLFYVGYACILVCIAAFGAIAALGNTLFPSASLIDGMVARSDDTAHFLERLTVVHPLLAIFGGLSLVGIVQVRLVTSKTAGRSAHLAAHVLTGLMLTNLVVGALDVALLAPMAVSTLHLLLADLIWLAFVWTAFEQATQSSASQTDAWFAPQEGKQMVEAKSPRPLTNPHGTP